MTRKDYIRIARALHTARRTEPSTETVDRTADLIADELALDNPAFDRERFLAAVREG